MRANLYGNGTMCLMFVLGAWLATGLPQNDQVLYVAAAALCPALALICILSGRTFAAAAGNSECRPGYRSLPAVRLAAGSVVLALAGAFACINGRILLGESGRLMVGERLVSHLSVLSDSLEACIGQCFSESTAALVSALLCGRKGGLGREVREAFRLSGGSHLLALSGLHLGIIYGLLSFLLAPLGKSRTGSGIRSLAICAICAIYVFATGAQASLTRAFIFVVFNELRRFFSSRNCPSSKVFATALTIHLIISPTQISETGFQLSYLAVLGALAIYPRLKELYPRTKKGHDPLRSIWSTASMSIACQLTTAGLVLQRFGTLPRHFLLTNIISLPLTTLLVCISLSAILLECAGLCPQFVKTICEMLAACLTFCMEIIAAM